MFHTRVRRFAEANSLVFICEKPIYPRLCLVLGSVFPSWFFLLFLSLCSKGIGVGLYLPFWVSKQHCLSFIISIQLWFQLWMTFGCSVAYCFRIGVSSVPYVQQGHLLCMYLSPSLQWLWYWYFFKQFLLSASRASRCSTFWNPIGTL